MASTAKPISLLPTSAASTGFLAVFDVAGRCFSIMTMASSTTRADGGGHERASRVRVLMEEV